MVCVALNRWRADTSVPDFVNWCRKVVEHDDRTLFDVHGENEHNHDETA